MRLNKSYINVWMDWSRQDGNPQYDCCKTASHALCQTTLLRLGEASTLFNKGADLVLCNSYKEISSKIFFFCGKNYYKFSCKARNFPRYKGIQLGILNCSYFLVTI